MNRATESGHTPDLEAENFRLAAGQCVVENGLIGDEHGHFYCALQRQRDELLEALELACGVLAEMVRYGYAHSGEVSEGSESGFYLGMVLPITKAAIAKARGETS